MLTGKKALLLIIVASAPLLGGCPIGALVVGGSTSYVVTGEASTEALMMVANSKEGDYAKDAVRLWLDRGQLPLPALKDGVHKFDYLEGDYVVVQDGRAARVIKLSENGLLIAEYVVSWDRRPAEYRLSRAVNRLYDAKLDVSRVPVIKTYTVPRG